MSGIRLTPVRDRPTSQRTAYLAFAVAAAIVVIAVGSIGGVGVLRGPGTQPGAGGLGSPSPSPVPSSSPQDPTTGTVVVTIGPIGGVENSTFFATLCSAEQASEPDGVCGEGYGGFVVKADADPFTTTQLVRVGPPHWSYRLEEDRGNVPLPWFDDAVAELAPGIYTLDVWVGYGMSPYGDWLPAEPIDRYCSTSVTIVAGERAEVGVTAVPARLQRPPKWSCSGAATPGPSPERTEVRTPIPTTLPSPSTTEVPPLGSPWSPGSQADIALVDELVHIWDDNDAEALDTVYAPDMALATGPGGYIADLGDLRGSLPTNPNSYARVSGVTVTTSPVPGLPRLPSGSRYVHFVSLIHGDLFDTILQVDDSDLVHLHFADYYEDGSIRLQTGFPDFPSPTPSAP